MLLFAAGEIFENKPSEDPQFPPQSENEGTSSLKSMCRELIRNLLHSTSPHDHLFGIVPKLELPPAVAEYLLYNITL